MDEEMKNSNLCKPCIALEPFIDKFLEEYYIKCEFSKECECESGLQDWTRLDPETGEAENYWCTICAIKNLLQEQEEGDGYVIHMYEKKLDDVKNRLNNKYLNETEKVKICQERILEP